MAIKKNPNIVARKIHGSSFLIDISDNYSGDKCALYEINETGMFIWSNIDRETKRRRAGSIDESCNRR